MANFKDRPKFFKENGQLKSYLYCSCCISRAYLPHEEGTEIFHVGGDSQKIYYCKKCKSVKTLFHKPESDDVTKEHEIVKEHKTRGFASKPLPLVKPKIEVIEDENDKDPESQKFFVIMLLNQKDQYCIQCCENVDQFMKDINSGNIKIFGLFFPPFKLVYKKSFSSEQLAKQRALEIKAYTRDKKILLTKGYLDNEY
jgi:predicted GIY-YIG superfamily endonuclease